MQIFSSHAASMCLIKKRFAYVFIETFSDHPCEFLLCSVYTEQSHGMLMEEAGQDEGDDLSSIAEHGQTVGDMNKSHKTDYPQVGVGLSETDCVPNFAQTIP